MEFRQIRYALAVAKERSFTKAAARLNISQSMACTGNGGRKCSHSAVEHTE